MKQALKWLYRIVRTVLVGALLIALATPVVLYVGLSLPMVQQSIKVKAEGALTELLGVKVAIGRLDFEPFNRITLSNVSITDTVGGKNRPIASIGRLGAGVNITASLSSSSVVVNYVELMGLNATVNRASKEAPLNIQPIIDALRPKDDTEKPPRVSLTINTIVIRASSATYDVLDQPRKPDGLFDPNHIAVNDLSADVNIPKIYGKEIDVDIRRLQASERSGLDIALKAHLTMSDTDLQLNGLQISSGNSRLHFADMQLSFPSQKELPKLVNELPFRVSLLPGSIIQPSNFTPLVPALKPLDIPIDIAADISGTLTDLSLDKLHIAADGSALVLDAKGKVSHMTHRNTFPDINLDRIDIKANGHQLATLLKSFAPGSDQYAPMLAAAGAVDMHLSGLVGSSNAKIMGQIRSGIADADIDAHFTGAIKSISGEASATIRVSRADLSSLPIKDLKAGGVESVLDGSVKLRNGRPVAAELDAAFTYFDLGNKRWDNVKANLMLTGSRALANVISEDPEAMFEVRLDGSMRDLDFKTLADLRATADLTHLSLDMLPLKGKARTYDVKGHLEAEANGIDLDRMEASALLTSLTIIPDGEEPVYFGNMDAEIHNDREPQWAALHSDILDLSLDGDFNLPTLANDARDIVSSLFPSLLAPKEKNESAKNQLRTNLFTLDVTIKETAQIEKLVKLPVSVVHPVEINALVNAPEGHIALNLDAPYLLQGNKIIENTAANIALDKLHDRTALYFATHMPTKKGPLTLTVDGLGRTDSIDTRLRFEINGPKVMQGEFLIGGHATREDGNLLADVAIHPSTLLINDTIWNVGAASVRIEPRNITIGDWFIGNDTQHLLIAGKVSDNPDETATVELHDIDLDYLFDTLNIDNVDFGGRATGTVTASDLLSGNPIAFTDGLDVQGLSYNGGIFGNAVIKSAWDHQRQGITMDADITQANQGHAYVRGIIYPVKDGGGLELNFDTDRTNIAFLQPFMSAFCSKLTGEVTGHARLFGTFSDLDLEGKAYVQDMRMTIPFTNTTYCVSDSVTFAPGNIELRDLTLYDVEGHTAKFSGWLKHRAFHDPVFSFNLYDARDFLCYSVPENNDQIWYGHIYGNGSATVSGRPGTVDIDVNIATAPNSTFGFVLSDSQSAGEYTFITFRDRDMANGVVNAGELLIPEAVRNLKKKMQQKKDESQTAFNMSINVEANPNVAVTLVMDPLAGDRIRAWGSGNLRMTYQLPSDEIRIFGTYTLSRGLYNFTLQDIIVKEFSIDPGSSIAFHGNPYAARLDMTAAYQTTANLTDLDESFKDDKDLNRTSVPVRALLKVTGDMRQPELAFDLSFPTLTSDIDRKVRSIVNTEEMLDRQVIYLLALNRFYTPESNIDAQRSNEFTSLATNTLSSRISSILGTISDKWSIAPTVRSELGDFSDMEVDLALSSHLLNNRLLINGNLGYRDKTLNTNGFVGDFDIEYLLNRRGNIRLKAYNRFNDQTFYVKNALTTQGVGVVFTRDFDSLTSWLKYFKGKKSKQPSENTDSIK